jgi:hypothetical protein
MRTVAASVSFAHPFAPIVRTRAIRFFLLLAPLLFGAVGALAQPLLSHLEESDQIRLRLWVSGCFQVEDNLYQFEMKDGKILCTGHILPDYVLPRSHPRVQVGPVELSAAQVRGIDHDIVRFRQTTRHSRRVNDSQVLVITRANEARTETVSEASLRFIEKGKLIIEETISCPNLYPAAEESYQGLAELKRLLQQQAEPEMERIKRLVSERARQPAADESAAEGASTP